MLSKDYATYWRLNLLALRGIGRCWVENSPGILVPDSVLRVLKYLTIYDDFCAICVKCFERWGQINEIKELKSVGIGTM